MKDCKNVRRKLSAFLDNELTMEEAVKLRQHLEKCVKCMRELDEMKGVWNLIGKIEDIEPSPYFWEVLHARLISQRKGLSIKVRDFVKSIGNLMIDLFDVSLKPTTIHTFSLDVFNDFPPESFGQLIYPAPLNKVK